MEGTALVNSSTHPSLTAWNNSVIFSSIILIYTVYTLNGDNYYLM